MCSRAGVTDNAICFAGKTGVVDVEEGRERGTNDLPAAFTMCCRVFLLEVIQFPNHSVMQLDRS